MTQPARPHTSPDRTLSRTILPTSGTMIGICTTLVGLVKILEGQAGQSQADEVGGLITLFFLASALLAYLAVRNMDVRPRLAHGLERAADVIFLGGLAGLVGLTILFAYDRL